MKTTGASCLVEAPDSPGKKSRTLPHFMNFRAKTQAPSRNLTDIFVRFSVTSYLHPPSNPLTLLPSENFQGVYEDDSHPQRGGMGAPQRISPWRGKECFSVHDPRSGESPRRSDLSLLLGRWRVDCRQDCGRGVRHGSMSTSVTAQHGATVEPAKQY